MKNNAAFTIEKCSEVAGILKTVSHPIRLMILCQLVDGPKTVSELEDLSEASQSSVSQFLARMKAEGLVSADRDGKFVHYQIKAPELKKLIKSLYQIYCG